MLKKIQSNAFISYGKIRPTIYFNKTLNICLGPSKSTNSIGKTNFLMCIDFAFGGNDYVEKLDSILKNIEHHEINFTFEFDYIEYHFSRSTNNYKIISICDESYNKTNKTISLNDFNNWLKTKYLIANNQTWRDIVSRFIRIYNRENINEKEPLRVASNEPPSNAIISILKLFNLYSQIENYITFTEEAKNKKQAYIKAQEFDYIPKINKIQFKENESKIIELETNKNNLANNSNPNILDLDYEKAEKLKELKSKLTSLKRQRGKTYDELNSIKQNKQIKLTIEDNFEDLKEFFPNQIDLNKLNTIESFHENITSILKNNFELEERKIWNIINIYNEKIKELESQINQITNCHNISKIVLEKYSQFDKEISNLKNQNNKYLELEKLNENLKNNENILIEKQMSQEQKLEEIINNKMKELNNYIFIDDKNNPILKFNSTKSYDFYTENDEGTGTNYKGLIIFDLACLQLTDLPFLIHDSCLFKNISKTSIEKIINLYLLQNNQIFISLDGIDSDYNEDIRNKILSKTVIKLSEDKNSLYGDSWTKK